MNARFPWPALRHAADLPPRLEYERGVWGKIHAARSDFRWIARSSGFASDRPGLYRELDLGAEDIPQHFQAWRCVGDRYYAVDAYRSRATDATGRTGFLEKQILEWRSHPDVPAALAVLVLIPHVARMTDAIWWDRIPPEVAGESDFYLGIQAADHAPVELDPEAVYTTIARGVQAIREAVGRDALAAMYDRILSGQKPAFLPNLKSPLPPEAVAALLLPLPSELAGLLSIGGWIPSSRAAMSDLGSRWDVLLMADRINIPDSVSPRAHELAGALLEADHATIEVVVQNVVPDIAGDTAASEVEESGPALMLGRWRPGWTLHLTSPGTGAQPILRELFDFARSPDRRWLAPHDLEHLHGPQYFKPDDPAVRSLRKWPLELSQQRPAHADEAQWRAKIELMRSAALVFCPDPSTVHLVGRPAADSVVPALLFALLLDKKRDPLAKLGATHLRELMRQSVRCRSRYWTSRVRTWLRQWAQHTQVRDFDLKGTISAVLEEANG